MAKKEKSEESKIANKEIEEVFKQLKNKDQLINVPRTLLKKEEWGLLTVLNLILAGIFPAYFVQILLVSFFTELGHLYTTHLTEVERKNLIEFEKEFRKGYDLELQLKWKDAVEVYKLLSEKYKNNPKIANIANQRIDWINKNYLS